MYRCFQHDFTFDDGIGDGRLVVKLEILYFLSITIAKLSLTLMSRNLYYVLP